MKTFRILSAAIISLMISATCHGQEGRTSLPRERTDQKIEHAIDGYIDAMQVNQLDPHSIMILQHGKVLGERWCNGWTPEKPHTMYSVSKTFTVIALGFAVQDGLVSVEDPVMSFFPETIGKIARESEMKFPDLANPLLPDLKVKHLLMMATGHERDLFGRLTKMKNGEDWVETFFKIPISVKPGTLFKYNSIATFMTSAIIQKVTGQKVNDYLHDRLLKHMGIPDLKWGECPQGINYGGWGLEATTEDMAKLGQFMLQKGVWEGKRYLPANWIEECSSYKIANDIDLPEYEIQANKISGDWIQGYCYQMWRGLHNSFRADGAYGQYIVVLPDQDAVVVMTANSKNIRLQMATMWRHILPVLK